MDKQRILVVDDEEDLREILKFNLESEGYLVDTAPSAEEALKMLSETYDLILLDVMMGGMSGFRMAEKLRKDLHNATPIIFLTAKDTENDMLTGFNIGGDDYISKPFSIKEVSARVKAVMKRAGSLDASNKKQTIDVGKMHIDLATKSVSIDEHIIPITKKEFEILNMLAQSPGKIFSREDILNKVWNDDSYVLERTVDVHITRLRKKLGEQGKHIVNRSGYGYCVEL
ncbi:MULTISPECIES: response regulator transcription factor [Odoribacteraceae]|uniref:response regulator transcription factor n=1 Tax=Odoribacteraceae TaxID=1853231 RepID=UPI000E51D801|nr:MULTISPECIES: response regulator transcription factor [Odoribacteraceae]MCQ4873659.1 response regulator transcription factor [Butyricimonas paravirosa]RHR76810.1 DNA-binding response regulator [Odoribacter sp. AF15-53]